MTQGRRLAEFWVVVALLTLLAHAGSTAAAPGDLIVRHPQPICPSGFWATGVETDGQVLYYTLAVYSNAVHRMDPRTGADLGSSTVLRSGVPVTEPLAGLGYDINRNALWIGGDMRMIGVRLSDMEVFRTMTAVESSGVECVTYDPFRDIVWESDSQATAPGPIGWSPADGLQDSFSLTYPDTGLAFDGRDFWHVTMHSLRVPDPPLEGVLYPTADDVPDWARVVDPPGRNWGEVAYDCVTFGKPVMWIVEWGGCAFSAYEIETTAPCILTPAPRIASAYLELDRSNTAQKFPLDGTRADRIFRAPAPLDIRDPIRVLFDINRPFVAYRWVDPQEAGMGNVLFMTKDSAISTVRIRQ